MNDELKIKNNELGGKINYRYRTDEEMKDSGVEWLGSIPNEWNIKKLKYLAKIDTGNRDTQDKEENGIYPFFVRSDTIERSNTYSFDGEAVLTAGDGVGVAKVFHYINGKFAYHQRVYKISDFKQINGKYLYYYIKDNLGKEVEKISAKTTVDSLRLPMFLNFPVLINEDGGKKISEFLDKKTAQFDYIISKKEALIEKLEEAKKSLISEVVTGKVKVVKTNDGYELVKREKEEMKDSGVEWLEDIPKEWDIKKVKHVLSEPLKYGANESAELDDRSLPRYIRITDFAENGKLKDETFKSLTIDKASGYYLNEGDILFARSGATVGKTFLFKNYKGKACFAGYLIKASVNKQIINPEFLYNFTKSKGYENWKNSIFMQATIQNIGADKYKELKFTLPNKNEQEIICEFIEDKNIKYNKFFNKINKQIEKLKEAKQSLISEAVTGKIEILD